MKVSTLCYITEGERVLMLHRTKKKEDINAGKWLGVGGKPEEGESPLDCVKREAREETGLTLLSPELRGVITFASDIYETEYMFLYTCDEFCGAIDRECDEGELRWVNKSEVSELPLWEGDRVFLPLILEEESGFFSLKLSYSGEKLISHSFE